MYTEVNVPYLCSGINDQEKNQSAQSREMIQMFEGGANVKHSWLLQRKPLHRDQRALEKPTGRYLQMLSRDEMRSLNSMPLTC